MTNSSGPGFEVDGEEIREALMAAARERILVLDGAMGTMIQGYRFTEEQFRGRTIRGLAERSAWQ